MPTFSVYEMQEELVWRCWRYEVEAESAEAALAACSGNPRRLPLEVIDLDDPVDDDEYGEPTLGQSGWGLTRDEAAEALGEIEAKDEADRQAGAALQVPGE